MARRLEFATTPGFCPALEGAAVARRSEELGFDVQMLGENHVMAADVFGELRDAARATERLRLLPGPVNFVTRAPGVVATAIASLQVVSDGRAICGVARGDSAVAMAGKRPQSSESLEGDLRLLRTLIAREGGEEAEGDNDLRWLDGLAYQPAPIEMACSGPRSISIAASLADRILLSVGFDIGRVRWALELIEHAARRAGRDREELRVGIIGPLSIAADCASGLAALLPRIAPFAHMSRMPKGGFPREAAALRRVFSVLNKTYDYRYHRADSPSDNPNNAVIDAEFAEWFGIGGPPSYVGDRLAELVDLGIDFISVALPEPERERFAEDIMPNLRALRA